MTNGWNPYGRGAAVAARLHMLAPLLGASAAGVVVGLMAPGPWLVRALGAVLAAVVTERLLVRVGSTLEVWVGLLDLGIGAPDVPMPSRWSVSRALSRPEVVAASRTRLAGQGLGREPDDAMYHALVAVLSADMNGSATRRARHARQLAVAAGHDDPALVSLAALLADVGLLFTTGEHHAAAAARAINCLGDAFEPVARAVAEHHAHWDGSGHPARLSGERIDPAARLVAAADVMASAPAHAMSPAEAMEAAAGQVVDPSLLALVGPIRESSLHRPLVGALPGLAATLIAPGVAAAATVTVALAGPTTPVVERAHSGTVQLPSDDVTLPTRDPALPVVTEPAESDEPARGIEWTLRMALIRVDTPASEPAITTTTLGFVTPVVPETAAAVPVPTPAPTAPPTTAAPVAEVAGSVATTTTVPSTTTAPSTTSTSTTTAPTTTVPVIYVPPATVPASTTTTTRRTTTTRKPTTTRPTTTRPTTTTTRPTTTTAAPTTTTGAPTTTGSPVTTTTQPIPTTTSLTSS